jgi:hypothetical protein
MLTRWRDSDASRGSISPTAAQRVVEARPPSLSGNRATQIASPPASSLWLLLVGTSLVAGFGNGYIGNVIYFMLRRVTFPMTHHQLVMAKAGHWIGSLCTMPFIPTMADVYGRKRPSLLGECVIIIGCIVQTAATNISILTTGRLIIGVGVSGLYVSHEKNIPVAHSRVVLFRPPTRWECASCSNLCSFPSFPRQLSGGR